MDYKVQNVTVEDEFKVCPSCGYKDGFHSMLKFEQGGYKWLFICPSCSVVYDIDYTIEMKEKFTKFS